MYFSKTSIEFFKKFLSFIISRGTFTECFLYTILFIYECNINLFKDINGSFKLSFHLLV